jgi:3-deoxy-manno-octulosonate cytidylyltransferase (CMP-KDO synthetase)
MHQVIVIPCRMSGTRLPGKPMLQLAGKPMLRHVWERCVQALPKDRVFIATEDEVIQAYCDSQGIQCVNTGPAETALHRVALFSEMVAADGYVNVQGDEPLINVADIQTMLAYGRRYPQRVAFGRCKCTEEEFYDASKAKVVCAPDARVLYSSRAGIPVSKAGSFSGGFRAIWVYHLARSALARYADETQVTSLDQFEGNEVLRFLELDVPVYCVDLIGDSWSIDEPKDVAKVEFLLKEQSLAAVAPRQDEE